MSENIIESWFGGTLIAQVDSALLKRRLRVARCVERIALKREGLN